MSAFGLAWRTATRYKVRACLAVAGVAIIGALNFDMLLLSRGLLVSFADLINSTGFDIRVVSGTGLAITRLPIADATKLVNDMRRLPEVADAALVRTGRAVALEAQGQSSVDLELVGTTHASGAGAWTLVRGTGLRSDPSAPRPPLVVSRQLSSRLGLEPGSTLRVRATLTGARSAIPPVDFHVVGVADFRFGSATDYLVATTMDGFERVHGGVAGGDADMVLAASSRASDPTAAAAAIGRLRPDLRAFSNDEVVAQFNRNGFAYFRQISLVLSTTTGVFAFMLVATLLTVSVNQRLGEVAALRALGVSRQRIAATLLWESAMLVGIGGVLALPLGVLLARILDRILRQMPGLPEGLHFFVLEPRALASHAALLVVTAVVAALYPMWLAVNLPIAETLRREVVS
jgi:putative ABC transport system permease protein